VLLWSADEDDQLRDLVQLGKSAAAIAKRLGRTEEAIRNRCHKFRISIKRIAGLRRARPTGCDRKLMA
jgi:hypothetical protein